MFLPLSLPRSLYPFPFLSFSMRCFVARLFVSGLPGRGKEKKKIKTGRERSWKEKKTGGLFLISILKLYKRGFRT